MPNVTIQQFPFVCQTFTVLFIVLLHFRNQRVLVLPIVLSRAVYRNFAKGGGRIWGMEKRGGAEADNSIV